LMVSTGFKNSKSLAQVSATQHNDYDPVIIKQKVAYLFDQLGGLDDIIGPGDRVAIKINLTGGAAFANHPNLQGVPMVEAAWTHPAVLQAVGEILIDSGVNPSDIYFVEALWDYECYNDYGYLDVQQYLGTQLVDLNAAAPYPGFANLSTGDDPYFYSSFIMNQVLGEVDALISIPKMKHHTSAGTTQSMKNLVGSVPIEFYQLPGVTGYRSAIHEEGGAVGYHLPRSICDINMARPVHLAVIDGIKTAVGGEGPWNVTFTPTEYDFLLAGKDPVATDSVATFIMGNDPEPEQLPLPGGGYCDNHLWLANQKGMGTNIMAEIEIVGDGAPAILGVDENGSFAAGKDGMKLFPNFPNPFRGQTSIRYYLDRPSDIRLEVLNAVGASVYVLFDGPRDRGEHIATWAPVGLSEGIYYCRLSDGSASLTLKLIHIN